MDYGDLSENLTGESKRLSVLGRLEILDTPEESLYQDAALLAAQICGTPMALVTLVDKSRQWFKAKIGVTASETPLELSFCAQAILSDSPTIVENALLDDRFMCNELVTGDMHLRFYAGVPVVADSVAVGTLCVLGIEARELSDGQLDALKALARQVSALLDQRLVTRDMVKQRAMLEDALEESEQLSRELQHASRRFANLFEGLPVACMTLDTKGNVMEWNRKSTEVYGYTAAEALLKPIINLVVDPKLRPLARRKFASNIKHGGNPEPVEWQVMRKDKTPIWVLTSSMPLHNPNGEIVGIISSNIDITERKLAQAAVQESQVQIQRQNEQLEEANAQLATLATTDGLTGLKNHRAFQDYFEPQFDAARAINRDLSIILLDVDKFKSFNDEFGHQAGDMVLKEVAEVLAVVSKPRGFVARYGGEEFIVVLPGCNLADALELAENYRRAIDNTAWLLRPVTASFGVASLNADILERAELIHMADEAMYLSKSLGRNRVSSLQSGDQSITKAA